MGTRYVYDPINGQIDMELDDDGNVLVEYTREPDGTLISEHRNGVSKFHHFDGEGNTLSLTDINGDVTDTFAYNAFGGVTARTGTTPTPFQYKGEHGYYWDEDIGDYMVGFRTLDPSQGRWLSPDPFGFVDGSNRYLHVQNNPVNFSDPTGLFTVKKKGGITHVPVPPDINPTEKRVYGAFWRLIWDRATDGDIFSQRVTNYGHLTVFVKPCKCEGVELPPESEICAVHSVHWRERFVEAWSKRPSFARDNHRTGPNQPALYLEEVIGQNFIREGDRLFLGSCPDRHEVTSWVFSMKATFELVNGAYDAVYPRNDFFASDNDFSIASLTICDKDVTPPAGGFKKMIYSGPTPRRKIGTSPPESVVPPALTANDSWRETWQTGMKKPDLSYETTDYQGGAARP